MNMSFSLSEPRSYLGTAVMFGLTFALPMTLFSIWQQVALDHRALEAAFDLGMLQGLGGGVLFGAVMGTLMRGETLTVSMSDPKAFVPRVNIAAAQLGYRPSFVTENQLCFRPSWQAGLLAGELLVQLRGDDAVVGGPRMYVRRLLTRLEE